MEPGSSQQHQHQQHQQHQHLQQEAGPPTVVRLSASVSLRTPVMVVAPMVGSCDLPFRELCREEGADLVYSEMFLADKFASSERYRRDALGDRVADSGPLIVQFAATNAADFAAAAAAARRLGAAGADLNLGCPQLRAKEGGYGAYLAEASQDRCIEMIRRAAEEAGDAFAITVKIRLQESRAATVAFATRLAKAGARVVTLHARPRGRIDARRDGAADLDVVLDVCRAVHPLGVAVFSNGNVRSCEDVVANLEATQAAGVMSAEEILRNPSVFADAKRLLQARRSTPPWGEGDEDADEDPAMTHPSFFKLRPRSDVVEAYLNWTVRCERRGDALRDDASTWARGKGGGGIVRAPSRDRDPGPRYSNWWANVDCIRHHVKTLLADHDAHRELLQRSTFRKAVAVQQLDTYLRRRFRLRTFDGTALPPPETPSDKSLFLAVDPEPFFPEVFLSAA